MHAEQIAPEVYRPAPGVYRLRTLMVNVYFVSDGVSRDGWTLIDTGLPGYAGTIAREAARLFGTAPSAILMTHGHFDHTGGLPRLADEWHVPVYAHPLELPYLTGESPYPPADPTVGGGAHSWLSPLFPRGPIDLGNRVHRLPENGVVPTLPGWQWLPTDGHSPGHVSFFREADRTLVAGDAVVTTRQESMIDVLRQRPIVWRPPAFFTCDWIAARRSVEQIAALQPNVLATGHGVALQGEAMRDGLRRLADRFDAVMPSSGRYVAYPAVTDAHGIVHVPPRPRIATKRAAVFAGLATAVGLAMISVKRHRQRNKAALNTITHHASA
jgi:glyoxylase-like metal-dependent hydrolase (beta-lactamase superfamily II)